MGKLLGLFMAVLAVGLVLFIGPTIEQRISDSNAHQHQLQLLEEQQRSFDLDQYRQRESLTLPAKVGLDYGFIALLLVGGGGILLISWDAYQQRRKPLVRADARTGLFPVSRQDILDGEIRDLVYLVATETVRTLQLQAIHQPGQLPAQYSPTYAPHTAYRNDVQASGQENTTRAAVTLPDTVLLTDIISSLPRGKLAYGMLPAGELLTLPLAAGYHVLYHGDTRSGKTNAIDSMLVQLHHKSQHYHLTIVAGDFKRELAATWNRSSLVGSVETDPLAIGELLEAIVNGPDGIVARYQLFERIGERHDRVIRNLGDYVKLTHEQPPLTFLVLDEINALLEVCDKKATLTSALKQVLQLGAGAGYYVLGGAQYLSAQVFKRDGSKQFVTRAHFGSYDKSAIGMMFGGQGITPEMRELITGQPGRGLIRTVGQADPQPFQALRCDEEDILSAITLVAGTAPERGESVSDQSTGESTTDSEPLNRTRTASERAEPVFSTSLKTPEITEIVRRLHATEGWGKSRIIETIWGVQRGGSRAYKEASATYDTIVRHTVEA